MHAKEAPEWIKSIDCYVKDSRHGSKQAKGLCIHNISAVSYIFRAYVQHSKHTHAELFLTSNKQ